jgi:hypothetical protein
MAGNLAALPRRASLATPDSNPDSGTPGPLAPEAPAAEVAPKAAAPASSSADVADFAALRAELELAIQGRDQLDADELNGLVSRAQAAVSRFSTIELEARREAGLYEVLQKWEPGVPLQPKDSNKLLRAYTAEEGEWRRTVLPPDQYTELYVVADLASELEELLESR